MISPNKIMLLFPLFLAACAHERYVALPAQPEMPSNWGRYQTDRADRGGCPNINGTYSASPQVARRFKGDIIFEAGHRMDFYGVFPFHDAQSTSQRAAEAHDDTYALKVQWAREHLTVDHYGADGTTIETDIFSSAEGDFDCNWGVLNFRLIQLYGQIEGKSINGQIRRSLALASDGAMIAIVTSGPVALNRNTRPSDFVHEFYRFKKL